MTRQQEKERAERQKREFMEASKSMKVSEICHRYHVQQCHVCDDLRCGDNTSAEKRKQEPL